MDISSYISELLFEHDCVIIPNFGGFICNYKPADIHPIQNTVSPPAKAISFNRNLQTNDGLLVNYIANTQSISFDTAADLVTGWVSSSKNLLKKKEDLFLKKIGKFSTDFEGNLQFAPTEEVNYLKTSFALRTITAEPIIRTKQIDFTEKFKYETKQAAASPRRVWSIAASVLLVVTLVALAELMWMGSAIKPIQIDQAGICSLFTNIFKAPQVEVPVETKNTTAAIDTTVNEEVEVVDSLPIVEPLSNPEIITTEPIAGAHTYYIVIGAFTEEKNIEAAKLRLQQKFSDSVILEERVGRLTKLGYSAGSNFSRAKEELATAQAEDASYWLLKK
jgi:hypothetical protein